MLILDRVLPLIIFSIKMEPKTLTFCVGGRHKCNTIDIIEHEKKNPKTGRIIEYCLGKYDIFGPSKSQIFTK